MTITIGLVANVFNEVNALPGWLETHLPFFDDVRVMHAGPQGQRSNDGTLEMLEKWQVPVEFCAIDDGFGVVRTKTLRMSPCDYTLLLDADERFFSAHHALTCNGTPTPHSEVDAILQTYNFYNGAVPDWTNLARLGANLRVDTGNTCGYGRVLRETLETYRPDVLVMPRRHWHDFSFCRPTQKWTIDPDWQMRLVRNDPAIRFDSNTRMHERLLGAKNVWHADVRYGPFIDHFHLFFKKMEQPQRAHDVQIYDAIHEGRTPPTTLSAPTQRGD